MRFIVEDIDINTLKKYNKDTWTQNDWNLAEQAFKEVLDKSIDKIFSTPNKRELAKKAFFEHYFEYSGVSVTDFITSGYDVEKIEQALRILNKHCYILDHGEDYEKLLNDYEDNDWGFSFDVHNWRWRNDDDKYDNHYIEEIIAWHEVPSGDIQFLVYEE